MWGNKINSGTGNKDQLQVDRTEASTITALGRGQHKRRGSD